MPRSWTTKDERTYERIVEQQKHAGKAPETAREIAARTVNKRRREEGRTSNRRSEGTGNPNTSLEARTRDELYNRARELNIRGRSRMRKRDLIDAIRNER